MIGVLLIGGVLLLLAAFGAGLIADQFVAGPRDASGARRHTPR